MVRDDYCIFDNVVFSSCDLLYPGYYGRMTDHQAILPGEQNRDKTEKVAWSGGACRFGSQSGGIVGTDRICLIRPSSNFIQFLYLY